VMMAEELGKIRLIMRSPEDDGIATVQDTTPGGLLDTAESEDRQEEALATGSVPGQSATGDGGFAGFLEQIRASGAGQEGGSVRARQVPGNVHRMQLVSGPEVKEVVLRQDVDQSESGAGVQLWTMSDWEPTPKLDQPQEPLAEEREQVPAAEAPRPEDKGQEGPPTGQ
jgi:hypothetical protein